MTKSVLLITSNGWGLGHLVRQLAIAHRMPRDVRCTILTLSQAAAVAPLPNLEYAPSYSQPWLQKGEWHGGYLRDRIVALANEVEADLLVYDGVVPYVGLKEAFIHLKAERVWVRRGLWHKKSPKLALRDSNWFDLIIEPGDVGAAEDVGPTSQRDDAEKVGVITQANPTTALPRYAAADALGINPYRRTLLLNVGSSAIKDLSPLHQFLQTHQDWQVIATKDDLRWNKDFGDVKVLTGFFPLHNYLSAVDLAVSSVGYNAAHEFIAMAVPTVFVPAPTTTDDQTARARGIAKQGLGFAALDGSGEAIVKQLERLMNSPSETTTISQKCREVASSWQDGATDAVELMLQLEPLPRRERWWQWLTVVIRAWLERNIGDALRHQQETRFDDVLISSNLTRANLASETPFEHILPTAEPKYTEQRSLIARKWLLK